MYICKEVENGGFGCIEIGICFNQCCQECPKLKNCKKHCDYAYSGWGCTEKMKVDEQPEEYINKALPNAEIIRRMTDKELAKFLVNFKNTFGEGCKGEKRCLKWLQSKAE